MCTPSAAPLSLRSRAAALLVFVGLVLVGPSAAATEWLVAPSGGGTGSPSAPFGRIQDALDAAQPGDVITVRPGLYRESLRTVQAGSSGSPVRLQSEKGRGSVVVLARGRVVAIAHPYYVIDGMVFDGDYGTAIAVTVSSAAHHLILRNTEVRRSSRDLIDIASADDVLIEKCLIHHALNALDGRTDAHGIAAGAVHNLVIRDSEIHTFSGDGIQLDPARRSPGWSGVTIERARIWLAPLATDENGFRAGTVPGENAVDTKAGINLPRSTIVIRDTIASGFRGGIENQAAFNLKENISAIIDGVTVSDSYIAFRLRGPYPGRIEGAWVTLKNAVVHHVDIAFRYEDNIENLRILNATVGLNVGRVFLAASSPRRGPFVRNLLVLGTTLPPESADRSNRAVPVTAFVNAAANDYHLRAGSPAIASGMPLDEVATDRDGTKRPDGKPGDVGAYQFHAAALSR